MHATQPCIGACEITEEIAPGFGPGTTLDDLSAAAVLLSEKPEVVRSGLRSLRSRPDQLDAIARQSYWHSNGFAKVKVAERDGFCVRLHIWPAGDDRLGDVDPHGHRWEFASWVAVGPGVAETHFAMTDDADPDGAAYAGFDYGRASGSGYLHPRGPVSLRRSGEHHRQAGDVYGCPLDVLHTVAPIGAEMVATVVLQGPILTETACVFRRGRHHSNAFERPITADQLGHLFGDVEACIETRGPR